MNVTHKEIIDNGEYTPIPHYILEAIALTNLSAHETRVYFFLWRKLYGYQKHEDTISNTQIMEGTDLDKSCVSRILKKLVNRNMVDKRYNKISLNLNTSAWRQLIKDTTTKPKSRVDNTVNKKLYEQSTGVDNTVNKKLYEQSTTKENKKNIQKKSKENAGAREAVAEPAIPAGRSFRDAFPVGYGKLVGLREWYRTALANTIVSTNNGTAVLHVPFSAEGFINGRFKDEITEAIGKEFEATGYEYQGTNCEA